MKLLMFGVLACCLGSLAYAECACKCVKGEVQPICASSTDLKPICGALVCPAPLSAVKPVQPITIPPLSTTNCRKILVLNDYTKRYEWKGVCS